MMLLEEVRFVVLVWAPAYPGLASYSSAALVRMRGFEQSALVVFCHY